MKRALGVTWFATRALYDELFPMAGMGLIWFTVAIVIPYGVFYLTSLTSVIALMIVGVLLSLIPVPPITGALYYVASLIAREKRIEFGYLWQGFKSHFGLSWKIGGVILVSAIILVIDISFYFGSDNIVFSVIGFLGLWAVLFWLAIQIYLFPLSFIQEDKSLRLILKNASLLTLAYPVFALGILIVTVLATALSALLVFILLATLWMPFVAILNSRAAISSLQEVEDFRQRQSEIKEEMQKR
jgi:uncharacterized membrane protein YesL